MLTDAKFTANQANAQPSTGPRTPEGKAAVSQNSPTFGLFASPEDQAEYETGELATSHDPVCAAPPRRSDIWTVLWHLDCEAGRFFR